MRIEIEGNVVRLYGKNDKYIRVYHDTEGDRFSFAVGQNGMEYSCLPSVTFCKEHTVCNNNLPLGKSFIE